MEGKDSPGDLEKNLSVADCFAETVNVRKIT